MGCKKDTPEGLWVAGSAQVSEDVHREEVTECGDLQPHPLLQKQKGPQIEGLGELHCEARSAQQLYLMVAGAGFEPTTFGL